MVIGGLVDSRCSDKGEEFHRGHSDCLRSACTLRAYAPRENLRQRIGSLRRPWRSEDTQVAAADRCRNQTPSYGAFHARRVLSFLDAKTPVANAVCTTSSRPLQRAGTLSNKRQFQKMERSAARLNASCAHLAAIDSCKSILIENERHVRGGTTATAAAIGT